MNGPDHQPQRWSRRRWQTTIGVVFAGQLLLVFVLSDRPPNPTSRVATASLFRMVTHPATREQVQAAPWLEDPAQFALVSARGFSGHVWRQLPRFQRQVMDWSEPPRWLTQELARLGASFGPLGGPVGGATGPIAERPAPGVSALSLAVAPLMTNSTLRIEGDLSRWRLLTDWELPAWTYADILPPSTVQVVVNRLGSVVSATLLAGGSGLAAADQRALELARASRFEPPTTPGSGRELIWGRMVFGWLALAEVLTNQPPTPRSP